jgi:DNA-binding NarL/FixJ family response regulator
MSSDRKIKVLVLHDDPLTRAGLIAALGSFADIEPEIPRARALEASLDGPGAETPFVDVLVSSYANGIDIAERFAQQRGARIRPRILIAAASDNEWQIRRAMECGIAGYLLTGCPLDHLAIGIRAVHGGARYFSPGVTQRLADSLSTERLTDREEAVLELVVDGLCNKAIANRLGVALGTVKTHLKAIFDKLSVETRTQAVITVARRGLLRQRMHCEVDDARMSTSVLARSQQAVSC